MVQIVHRGEQGHGLEITAQNKLAVKAGRNVTVDQDGVHVTLPEAQEIPAALNGASISGNTLTFTQTRGQDVTVQLPAAPVDVKLQSLEFTAQGKLKATLSDNSTTEVDFNAEVVVKAVENADDAQKQRLVNALLPKLRGEELQNLAGETKGYLLPTA